jgi:thiosulfate dehydrogenase (quinone) large subunit
VSDISSPPRTTLPATAVADRQRSQRQIRPLASWGATSLRLAFGIVFAINAVLKWLPGYRDSYLSQLKDVAQGQPSWLHGWFHFWVTLQSGAPSFWADLTGVTETALALVLLLGVARRPGYLVGAGYMLLVWAVGEGFGGPYVSGSTDVGTGIIYTLLFLTMFVYAAPSLQERLSVDRLLAARHAGWRRFADLSIAKTDNSRGLTGITPSVSD